MDHEEKLETIRKLDDGTDMEVTIGDPENGVEFHYTNKLQNINSTTITEVEMISTENIDKDLLHRLVTEMKK
jgi:hypothetical protein